MWRKYDPGYSSEGDTPMEKWKGKCGPKGEVTCERSGKQNVRSVKPGSVGRVRGGVVMI